MIDKYESELHPAVAKAAGESLPRRRYVCVACGAKGKRNNSREARLSDPICPKCKSNCADLDRLLEWQAACLAKNPNNPLFRK